ncbi:hypothetical protein PROPEN_04084 [Proteus penneri ATCC 35198]|nr:hypothetical protein PROPEN_04084 [Proteus penneri ATCC 35198]
MLSSIKFPALSSMPITIPEALLVGSRLNFPGDAKLSKPVKRNPN